MHRNCFVDKFQFAREVIELAAHLIKTLLDAGRIIFRCIQKTVEGRADEARFGGPRAARRPQPIARQDLR